jgi:hypothetical protein
MKTMQNTLCVLLSMQRVLSISIDCVDSNNIVDSEYQKLGLLLLSSDVINSIE